MQVNDDDNDDRFWLHYFITVKFSPLLCVGITRSSRASLSSSSSLSATAAAAAADNQLPTPTTPHLRARRSLPDSTSAALQTTPKRARRY